MLAYVTLVAACMLLCVSVNGEDWNQTMFEQLVDDYIQSGLRCHNNPALSISVVKGGKVLLTKGYGYKKLDKQEPVTENTLFGIASVTKSFAATLMLKQLEDSESLSLSTSLRSLFGRDDIFKSSLRSRYATIEDLLAHRIGLPSNNRIRLDDTLTRKNLIDRIKYLSVKGGFRTSFYYSNLMYGLITYLSEKIGGKSWEDLISEKIFAPLGMTSSTFVTTADPEELDLATGYSEVYGEMVPVSFEFSRRWGELCGSGCILTNAADMTKWMMFHLNQGKNTSYEKVLSSDMLEEAHKPQNAIPSSSRAKYYTKPTTPVTISESTYGFGWRLGYYRGYPMWSHSGSTYGYRALLTLLPNTDIGVFSVMTGDDPDYIFRTNIHMYLADLALGIDPWLDNTTVCTFPEPWQSKTPKDPDQRPNHDLSTARSLDEYTGAYVNAAYGTVDVYRNGTSGQLMATMGYGQFILYPKTTADEFFAEGYGLLKNMMDFSNFTFAFDANQTASSLIVPSFERSDPPIFQRKIPQFSHSHSNGCQATFVFDVFIFFALVILSEVLQI